MTNLEELKEIITNSKKIVFFGGAGVSTESGIPDFRGTGGLYTSNEEDDGMAPEEKLHISYLLENPRGFYKYYKSHMIYEDAKPNDAHYALSELEKMGKMSCIVTQNIDGLHQMAGSKNVMEIHGTVRKNYCTQCGKEFDLDYILSEGNLPLCDECDGLVRPDVVLYGEGIKNWFEAVNAIAECDTLIVAGTSLTVYPAAGMIDYYNGENLVIINTSPTPRDNEARLVINEPCGKVLSAVISELK